ncbi:MAG TPA: class I SAM-dependent methyltransferase [Nitrospira sp.]|nr:class I SAM-dependent methyltransferase [Nitrospira sp.]HNC82426.1 class I SAM-dependent methyltransferase [Nitrospira sp.]
MSAEEWSDLNSKFHHHLERNSESKTFNQPPYAEQALALQMLNAASLIDPCSILDYAAGYGTLARVLKKYFKLDIDLYDPFVINDEGGLHYVSVSDQTKYKLVINSAMFEHVLDRRSLDRVNELVADDGVLMLHTVICERVPPDPNWFYLEPVVHTAFHTNASMKILMEQWGYASSVYSPQAKCWFLFKEDNSSVGRLEIEVAKINAELQTKWFHYKQGFMDYWKGF